MESRIILPGDKDFSIRRGGRPPFMPGTVKPERKYRLLERLGAELGIPVPMMFVKAEATNPDGSPGDKFEDRSRTYNRNFWNNIYGCFAAAPSGAATFAAGFLAIKATGGTVSALNYDSALVSNTSARQYVFGSGYGAVSTVFGIVVGTGTAAENFEDVALGAVINSGNGAGQLSYTAQNATTVSYNAGTKTWTATLARIYNNNSGGTIIVGETGIYGSPNGSSYMFCRDKLGATVSVLTAGQLTVTYTVTLVFPA